MTDSKMEEVKDDRKLKGKTNFVSWKRDFERAAKVYDVLEYLTGKEVVPPRPRKDDYFPRTIDADTRRQTRAMSAQAQAATPSTEGDEDPYEVHNMMVPGNTCRWQIDYAEHKNAKERMRVAGKLLDSWVSEGIKIEIEDCEDAKEAYDFIKRRYFVTNERARDTLLTQLNGVRFDDCVSMTEYTNKVRQIKADLKTVAYDMTDDMFATALLHGLPPNFRIFKENYDWVRSIKPDDPPDLDYLFERLHVEEAKQIRLKDERRVKDRVRKEASTADHANSPAHAFNRKHRRERNGQLKCTYPSCGKPGHTEETCWTKYPSKAPSSLKDKLALDISNGFVDGMAGTTAADPNTFKDVYSSADDIGTAFPPAPSVDTADNPLQMRRLVADVGVQESGGAGTQALKFRESSLGKKTSGAFLIGTSCTPDTWLADTGANMHIVNDVKWFKKNSFRSFHNCSMDISTADGSTTLEIKGGGTVQILLKNPNGSISEVSLSDVAYAPQGKCNLFSGGIFAQKARLTGVYNDRYMTWVDKQGGNIGYAVFENGLYHLDIETTFNSFGSGEVVAATVNFDDPVWKWHRRLGHLGFQNMLKLLDSSTGMNITPEQIRAKLKAVCPVCAVTRALVKIPRDPAKRHAEEPGQMVHVDSWGPYPIEGFDGTKFFIFVTDDCTRYTWCARFDHKHELFEIFKTLLKFIQKTYNIVIRCCRLDNEFENGPIGTWCDAHAIAREPIEPYAHYQNGVAERTNRTIRERAAPMIQESSISGQISKIISEKSTELLRVSKIPENLWPEAVQHAVWLKNRTPARALRKKEAKTPYEALKGEKPTLSRERIWGSRTYVTYPPEFRDRADMTKLHNPRGWLGYFVGCESEAIYKVYSPDKHRVYRIGVARIEDGEGLEDLHDQPCLEDRVPRVQAEMSEQSVFPSNVDAAISPEDQNDALSYAGNDISELHSNGTGSDTEPASDDDTGSPGVVSRYFAKPRHAGMAKRKMEDSTTLAPKNHREATHTIDNLANDQSSSEESDLTSDSWYYSDGKVSQEYLDFVAKHGQRTTRTYLPDDRKCDSCFRFNLRCDCTSEGVRCSTCVLKKKKCVPQTEKTKRLILPENRGKARPIAYPELERPCRLCFQTDRSCHLAPGDIQCERCKSKGRKCRWDLDGAHNSNARQKQKDAKELATQEKLGFKRVPRDRKCYRCAQRNIACDGEYPCVKCNTLLTRRSCRPQGMEQLAACNCCLRTRDKGRNCDRGRPCRSCMEQKRNCTYDASTLR